MTPQAERVLRYFEYRHLPAPLQGVSGQFAALAHWIATEEAVDGAEQTVALRKLLEAKDAAVRSMLPKRTVDVDAGPNPPITITAEQLDDPKIPTSFGIPSRQPGESEDDFNARKAALEAEARAARMNDQAEHAPQDKATRVWGQS